MHYLSDMLARPSIGHLQARPVEPYLPPGYRFHPTDEELVVYYLANKVADFRFTVAAIGEADLNKCEPWDLPDRAKMGEKEWYFFSLKDRKYPTGLRTNRATMAGYWKATGKDREVMSNRQNAGYLVGMKKTLVFYKGRAPKGEKTNWIMHEYRLDGESSSLHFSKPMATCKDEWVVCRIFKKNIGGKKVQSDGSTDLDEPALPALLESPHTQTCGNGAEDTSGITDSEQRAAADSLSCTYYHSQGITNGNMASCVLNHASLASDTNMMNLWHSRAMSETTNSNLTGLTYPEQISYNATCDDPAYFNLFRHAQLSQNLSQKPGMQSNMELYMGEATTEEIGAASSSSASVMRILLEQFPNSGRPCKVEPEAVEQSQLPKLANMYKHTAASSWSENMLMSAQINEMEAPAAALINTNSRSLPLAITPNLAINPSPTGTNIAISRAINTYHAINPSPMCTNIAISTALDLINEGTFVNPSSSTHHDVWTSHY